MIFSEALKSLKLKFTSGNEIPVERAQITREEFESLLNELDRLQEHKYN